MKEGEGGSVLDCGFSKAKIFNLGLIPQVNASTVNP